VKFICKPEINTRGTSLWVIHRHVKIFELAIREVSSGGWTKRSYFRSLNYKQRSFCYDAGDRTLGLTSGSGQPGAQSSHGASPHSWDGRYIPMCTTIGWDGASKAWACLEPWSFQSLPPSDTKLDCCSLGLYPGAVDCCSLGLYPGAVMNEGARKADKS
jgi:hypothetical protein